MIGETRSRHTSFQPSRAIRASMLGSRGWRAAKRPTAARNSDRLRKNESTAPAKVLAAASKKPEAGHEATDYAGRHAQ